jgi:rare lipoprotein A
MNRWSYDSLTPSRSVLVVAVVVLLIVAARYPHDDAGERRQARAHVGLASYYGAGFHGEETASGEVFNQRAMTAAHRTLPLGTVVRVTNLKNDRTVVVRINDRGPYGRNHRRGTIIDLSRGAAQRLRFIDDGLVRVRVEVVEIPEAGDRP